MQLEIEQKISQEKEKIFAEIENFLTLNLEQKKALESYVSMLLQENGKYLPFLTSLIPTLCYHLEEAQESSNI